MQIPGQARAVAVAGLGRHAARLRTPGQAVRIGWRPRGRVLLQQQLREAVLRWQHVGC
ncbi:hypothetical protein [Paraburkholderia agricolaris]|uniref:hypothetical protein n=1 Tax=Paraburkholderia agricolaris TaxID=2152888 RepID=UPI001291EAFA|nr:hypothetical protein [Paraburkholderia agricolaris]